MIATIISNSWMRFFLNKSNATHSTRRFKLITSLSFKMASRFISGGDRRLMIKYQNFNFTNLT